MAALPVPWAGTLERDSLVPCPGARRLSSVGALHRVLSLISGILEPQAPEPPLIRSPYLCLLLALKT